MMNVDSSFSAVSAPTPRVRIEAVASGLPHDERPRPGFIHLWRTQTAHLRPLADVLETTLSPEERERQARFVRAEDRQRFGLFRGFLREVLGAMVQTEPAALRFILEPGGKPGLDAKTHPGAPAFNVSHSGDVFVAAFACGGAIGVDVEQVDRRTDVSGVARHSFHPHEYAHIAAADDARQRALFFRWWTAKEAVLKASGAGIGAGLARLDFSAWVDEPCAVIRDVNQRAWTVWHYGADGVAASLAASTPFTAVRVRETSGPGTASGELITRSS